MDLLPIFVMYQKIDADKFKKETKLIFLTSIQSNLNETTDVDTIVSTRFGCCC